MNLIQQSVQQITRENLKNYYDTEQAEDELFICYNQIVFI